MTADKNQLYFGDNLHILREALAEETVDLIYLDPPFNSKRDYNLLFKSPKGQQSEAQITAFEDSWHWGEQAEREFDELLHQPNTDVAEMMRALRSFLGENDMLAYLTMMANRLLELHRVLKPTGSLYLHCDPTASHYLKVVLDGVFGKINYKSEINWRRSSAHNDAKQGRKQYGNVRDVILFYTKSDKWTWNWVYTPYTVTYLENEYRHKSIDGRFFKETDPTANKPGGDVSFEWRVKRRVEKDARWEADLTNEHLNPLPEFEYHGVFPYQGRYWAYSKENLTDFALAGKLRHRKTGMPRIIQFADEMPGVPLQSDWQDVPPVMGDEYLGYETQKPVALLERILSASSNEGDVVLDPFCGCGTAVHAAQKLKRKWIGIDITHLAISLIEKRLKDAFGKRCKFEVHGTPKDLDAARDLAERDKYQFQWWAISLVDAQPFQGKKKGADTGIDGLKFFYDLHDDEARKIVVSVKGGSLKADDVRALNHVREREKADIGLLISLNNPTAKMKADAASAGIYHGGADGTKQYPRIQLLTIAGLLGGGQRAEHPDYVKNVNFKKAKKEVTKQRSKRLFDDAPEELE
jgi:DNA modification methylase